MRLGQNSNQSLEGGAGDTLICLVGRELCLYLTVDASRVPEKQRMGFISLAVQRAAPFPDPDFGIAWTGSGHASVWYWSRARVTDRLEGLTARRVEFTPEALYIGQAADDEAQLLALDEGVEGRIWSSGQLVASRWWPTAPSDEVWRTFLRSVGSASRQPTPNTLDAPLSAQQWSQQRTSQRGMPALSQLDAYLPRVALACTLLFATAVMLQVGIIVRSHVDVWRARSAASDLDESLKRILAARESADRNLAEIDALLALRPNRQQVPLLAEVSRLIPGSNWHIVRWNQPTPDRLEVALKMPDANPEQLVTALEASSMLTGVTTDIDGRSQTVSIRAQILPATAAPASAPAPASGTPAAPAPPPAAPAPAAASTP